MRYTIIFILLVMIPLAGIAQIEWTEHWIEQTLDSNSIFAADINGDGLPDILSCSEEPEHKLVWYENLGAGTFSEHRIDTTRIEPNVVHAVDLDGDGDMDVVAGGLAVWPTVITCAWWENDGEENFTRHMIGEDDVWRSISTLDLDSDGDLDIVVSSDRYIDHLSNVAWWENDGAQNFTEHVINDDLHAEEIATEDMDADGDIDIMCAANEELFYWENDGAQNWTEHIIDFRYGIPYWAVYCLTITDIDGDGDPDVVAGTNSAELLWYENDGMGNLTRHLIYDDIGSRDIVVIDLDSDNDLDLVTGGYFGNPTCWWRNDGNEVFQQNEITYRSPHGLDVADFNGDGNYDVCICLWGGGYPPPEGGVLWYEMVRSTPVELTLTPTSLLQLPPGGGTLVYNLHLVSSLPNAYDNVSYRTYVELPNNDLYGPLFEYPFTLTPFMDATYTGLTQDVPAYAPPGDYQFIARAGYQNQYVEASFEFSKYGGILGELNPDDWQASGLISEEASVDKTLIVPDEYVLQDAHPNPFNAATTVHVKLPEATDLTVSVYNVAGQQVAELANGQFNAGQHDLTFDASVLASGLYFIRTIVPGRLDQTQKVMLVR
jgi:FG-GAP-like repeat/Secretion system C-terminal sorting domain